jgi:glycosyltransferase involved in cell wall biosynthesis
LAIARYNTFIFSFGQSLFPGTNFDLVILKWLRKRVIMNIGHGSEARPAYLDGVHLTGRGARDPKFYFKSAKKMRAHIRFLEKYCSVIIGSPLSSHFFSSTSFVNWFEVGIPAGEISASDANELPREGRSRSRKESKSNMAQVTIVHAPSAPLAKGSREIRSAIESLKRKGWDISLVELINVPHRHVLEALANCDFVVDQLYSDSPLPGLATEAATFGKPTILGSYALEQFVQYAPKRLRACSFAVHPSNLRDAIEHFLAHPDEAVKMGRLARDFVETEWSNRAVALRYLSLIQGAFPENWLVDPLAVIYAHGACQSSNITAETVHQMVTEYGQAGLFLDGRRDLIEKLLLLDLDDESRT